MLSFQLVTSVSASVWPLHVTVTNKTRAVEAEIFDLVFLRKLAARPSNVVQVTVNHICVFVPYNSGID